MKLKAVYFEDYKDHCQECCLYDICGKDGKCTCDCYRGNHNPDCEGSYYFVNDIISDEELDALASKRTTEILGYGLEKNNYTDRGGFNAMWCAFKDGFKYGVKETLIKNDIL